MLDVEQATMILSMEAQQPDGSGPALIDMFEQDARDAAQRLAAAASRDDRQVVAHEAQLKGVASLYANTRTRTSFSRGGWNLAAWCGFNHLDVGASRSG